MQCAVENSYMLVVHSFEHSLVDVTSLCLRMQFAVQTVPCLMFLFCITFQLCWLDFFFFLCTLC